MVGLAPAAYKSFWRTERQATSGRSPRMKTPTQSSSTPTFANYNARQQVQPSRVDKSYSDARPHHIGAYCSCRLRSFGHSGGSRVVLVHSRRSELERILAGRCYSHFKRILLWSNVCYSN